jgi:hypothetical protein
VPKKPSAATVAQAALQNKNTPTVTEQDVIESMVAGAETSEWANKEPEQEAVAERRKHMFDDLGVPKVALSVTGSRQSTAGTWKKMAQLDSRIKDWINNHDHGNETALLNELLFQGIESVEAKYKLSNGMPIMTSVKARGM